MNAMIADRSSRYLSEMLPRLVCFDAGFTLIRPRWTLAEQLAAVLEAHGHRATDADLREAWEAADAWFWDTYHQSGNTAWTSDAGIEDTWRAYHRLMLDRLGFTDPGHDLMEAMLGAQFASDAWEPYPETVETLELVRSQPPGDGLEPTRIAVVSDWGSTLGEVFDHLGLRRYVDVFLVSAAEGLAKPDPAFFRRAAEQAGAAPGEAVMIGDSYRADVLGARAAGMSAILLDRAGTAREMDVPIARDLRQAVALAAELETRARPAGGADG
jgi:putative hydrolase of the HAD superfamily